MASPRYPVQLLKVEKSRALKVLYKSTEIDKPRSLSKAVAIRLRSYLNGDTIYDPSCLPVITKEQEYLTTVYTCIVPYEDVISFQDFKQELLQSGIGHVTNLKSLLRYLIIEIGNS